MKREDLRNIDKHINSWDSLSPSTKANISLLWHKIHDDIESRICANCEYWKKNCCRNRQSPTLDIWTAKNYGCNYFEKIR